MTKREKTVQKRTVCDSHMRNILFEYLHNKEVIRNIYLSTQIFVFSFYFFMVMEYIFQIVGRVENRRVEK